MMNHVIHHETSQHGDLGQRHQGVASLDQRPGFKQVFIARPLDGGSRSGYVVVEYRQKFFS
jgi:hypothetical protein